MRVIDCECGAVVQAGNDDDLARRVREHMESDHPESDTSEEAARRLVSERAYTATDS
jgi:predicted small metal-binding protein